MEAHAPALTAHSERAERAWADAEALSKTVRESSERMMEALYRRDQESDERAAAHLRVLEDEQAVLATLLEAGRDQVAQSVIDVLPAMIDTAVRTAMDRYATERRASVREMANQVRADLDVMREGLQRSFEKMMEALAVREQQLDERTAANGRMVDHERAELAALRDEVTSSLAEATPLMVADAIRSATEQLRIGTGRGPG